MGRRRLLAHAQWNELLAIPQDERTLIQHYTLSRDDLDMIASKRLSQNRLGFAVQLCLIRHPGRTPDPDETLPAAFLAFIAVQVDREETYASALARIIDAHRALPLAAAWGDGTTSSTVRIR